MQKEYKHGIETERDSAITLSTVAAAVAQAVVGTAPVNLLSAPEKAVNVPVLVTGRESMREQLGMSTDYKNYTLMQTYLASFQKVGAAPIVMVNVLDPNNVRHITVVASEEYTLTKGSLTVQDQGILLKSLIVSKGDDSVAEQDKDYVAAFDVDGNVMIAVTDSGILAGEERIRVAYSKLNPAGVTPEDIMGGKGEDGRKTGIALFDEIYSRFQIVPAILSAPEYSQIPAVAAALETKAELVGDLTSAVAVIDIESSDTGSLEKVRDAKDKLGALSRMDVLCWPRVVIAGNVISASAVQAAMLQYAIAGNNNVPASIDNMAVPIDGIALEDGTQLYFTQREINDNLNAYGVNSFINMGGWKCWGSNSAAYPDKTDPNDRFIKCVMIGNYLENRFKTEYLSQVGRDASLKFVESLVGNFNVTLNALVPDYLAGAEVIFDKDENTMSQLLEGHFRFHTRYADYTPAGYIVNRFTWDSKILQDALTGGEK